jgi:hypothetical protein
MKVRHSYECEKCGVFDRFVRWDADYVRCKCGKRAVRAWVGAAQRPLAEPIVMWRKLPGFAGGPEYQYPGHASARTPQGYERVECRTAADYRRLMRDVNRAHQATESRDYDRVARGRAAYLQVGADQIRQALLQTDDSELKDTYRAALEYINNAEPGRRPSQMYNEAMEYDASNRDASSSERGRRK